MLTSTHFLVQLLQYCHYTTHTHTHVHTHTRAHTHTHTHTHTNTLTQYKDLMQLMIDTQVGSDGFTDGEIISQTMTFMIGVHENLCNVIAHTIYLLALNPSVQDKLRTEIRKFFRNNPVS